MDPSESLFNAGPGGIWQTRSAVLPLSLLFLVVTTHLPAFPHFKCRALAETRWLLLGSVLSLPAFVEAATLSTCALLLPRFLKPLQFPDAGQCLHCRLEAMAWPPIGPLGQASSPGDSGIASHHHRSPSTAAHASRRRVSTASRSTNLDPTTSSSLDPANLGSLDIAQLQVESSSDSDAQPSRRSSKPSHGRSMSNPFPSLFSTKKKKKARGRSPSGFSDSESSDDAAPMHKSRTGRQASVHTLAAADQGRRNSFTTGPCITCGSLMRWAQGVDAFRCSICLTVNDLVLGGTTAGPAHNRHIRTSQSTEGKKPSALSVRVCVPMMLTQSAPRWRPDFCRTDQSAGSAMHPVLPRCHLVRRSCRPHSAARSDAPNGLSRLPSHESSTTAGHSTSCGYRHSRDRQQRDRRTWGSRQQPNPSSYQIHLEASSCPSYLCATGSVSSFAEPTLLVPDASNRCPQDPGRDGSQTNI